MQGLTSLWMGDIHANMDEKFIIESFGSIGQSILGVRIMRNKYNGLPLGYCFIHFSDANSANKALMECQGKLIPNSDPPILYKLNEASAKGIGFAVNSADGESEYVLWVGDLSKDVDDAALHHVFASRYKSLKVAKVIKDEDVSRGYAFVRFSDEEDHKDALANMHGYVGLGNKPLKVGLGMPKPGTVEQKVAVTETVVPATTTKTKSKTKKKASTTNASTTTASPTTDAETKTEATDAYAEYYASQGWSYDYYAAYGYYDPSYTYSNYKVEDQNGQTTQDNNSSQAYETDSKNWDYNSYMAYYAYYYQQLEEQTQDYRGYRALADTPQTDLLQQYYLYEDTQPIPYESTTDTQEMNAELVARSWEFWDCLDSSRWLPMDQMNTDW